MTTAASENRFRTVRFAEHVDPATPPADEGALFLDTDGILKWISDAGVVSNIALGSAGFSDPMTSRGDIIVRNASNVTARLAKGSADTYLGSDGTDVAYSAVTDAKLSTSDITTNNASTSKHGFLKKLDNNAAHFMDGTGAWSTPSAGAAALTNNVKVDTSGNHNVTSTTDAAVDTTNLRVSLTTTASGVALVMFSSTARANSSAVAKFSFRLDGGTSVGGSQGITLHALSTAMTITYHWLFTGLSAAAHTFDVSAWVDTGSVDIGFSSSNRSILTAIQIA